MDYAIIQKQVSAPKFVIFLTLAAGINSFTYSCQNFIFSTIFPALLFYISFCCSDKQPFWIYIYGQITVYILKCDIDLK